MKYFKSLKTKRIKRIAGKIIGRDRCFYPTQLAIELFRGCNARCVMCPSETMRRSKGAMDDKTHRIVLDKVKEWGAPIDLITHAGLGEPLLDRNMEKKIAYEKNIFPDAQVFIYSNGGLLSEERAHRILDSGVDLISFSVNGFFKETYENVMKIPRDKTYHNINMLLEIREKIKSKVRVQVSIIPTDLIKKGEIEEFENYWKSKVDAVIIPSWISWGNLFDNYSKKEQLPCFYIWKVLMVDIDGTVKMCCEDYDSMYPMGNVLKKPLDEIFNSARMQKQRENQSRGNFKWPEICDNCIETHESAYEFWKNKPVLKKVMQ